MASLLAAIPARPVRAAPADGITVIATSAASSAPPSTSSSSVSILPSLSGASLVSDGARARGDIVLADLPLAVLPPFVSIRGGDEWSKVEAKVRQLRFTDDALLLYRAIALIYLLDVAVPSTDISESIKQRLLALYDPSTDSSRGGAAVLARLVSRRRTFTTALNSEIGAQHLVDLFAIVARQLQETMRVPIVLMEASDPRLQSETFQHSLLHLAYIYNSNNMDGLVVLPGADSACTVVYDRVSRINHSCVSSCVHYLADEDRMSQGYVGGEVFHLLVPQLLEGIRQVRSASSPADVAASACTTAAPFLRILRALRPIEAGEELTISYLSPQLLCQNTQKRNEVLQKQWGFYCRCERCAGLDMTRVLQCPACETGSILIKTIDVPSSSASTTAITSDPPPFTLVHTCECVIPPAATSILLADEQAAEEAFLELRASIFSSPAPLALLTAFGVSLKIKRTLSDLHWIRYEFHQIMGDLSAAMQKRLDQMDAVKLQLWYLERVLRRETPTIAADLPAGFAVYDQSSLLIDVTSARYLSPSSRVLALYACSELADAYSSFADLCWAIHVGQTPELARLLAQRAVYFTKTAVLTHELLASDAAQRTEELRTQLAQRAAEAKAKGVDLARILADN